MASAAPRISETSMAPAAESHVSPAALDAAPVSLSDEHESRYHPDKGTVVTKD